MSNNATVDGMMYALSRIALVCLGLLVVLCLSIGGCIGYALS